MGEKWQSWGRRPFRLTSWACAQFVALTALAMVVYPGGSRADPTSRGYSFWQNFFSDLGLTVSRSGRPNNVCLVLFVVALTVAGLGLVLFFVAVPQFFWHKRFLRVLSLVGSTFGILSGLCYIGVAWTPANLIPSWHGKFTLWGFEAFLVTAVIYALATSLHRTYPKAYAAVYAMFAALLAAYVWLLINGPRANTARGLVIQATGQKIIAYAAIVCVFIQGRGAERVLEKGLEV